MEATTNDSSLTKEQALAKRWLRMRLRPLESWQWLSGAQSVAFQSEPISTELLAALNQFAEPLGVHSNQHQQQALAQCLDSVAGFMIQCRAKGSTAALPCIERMLAASLIPLYRGLAKGTVTEVCSVLRRQLADCVSFSLLVEEFHDELEELLASMLQHEQSPYECLKKNLDLDLELLTQYVLSLSQKWDGNSQHQLRKLADQSVKPDQRPSWGSATTLWRLAGELISDRAEFVVPRDWINVPVPWNEASEHWRGLARALATACLKSSTSASQSVTPAIASRSEASAASLSTVSKPLSNSVSTEPSVTPSSTTAPNERSVGGNALRDDEIQRLKLEIEIADAVDSLVQASRSVGARGSQERMQSTATAIDYGADDDFVLPKVIIAEVRSHNDPAFVSVVRRQLSLCRTEAREMSLIAVCVISEGEEGNHPTLKALGLASWQQKLVNWISDHPEVHDLYAFVSNEGELILSLMDLERNSTTGLLRQGLVEVLAGATVGTGSSAALSRAPMPARYYSGIGSVAAPSAGFEPEQLIEATYRCLEAAQRQGKSAIKSIEVF